MIRSFSLALQFLTRIPVPVRFVPEAKDWGYSTFFFPFVGLLVGVLMAGLAASLPQTDPGVVAVVLLTSWVLVTGGLHLDGLADTADAWIGGYGDADKTLAIMKDPRSGPMAVMAIVLIMLTKFAALKVVVEHAAWQVLVWAPVLGRAAMLLMLLTTPYVRAQGIGTTYAGHLPRPAGARLLLAIAIATLLTLGWAGTALLLLLGLGFIGLRRALLRRLGGSTGDTLGATCELTETSVLLVLLAS